MKTEITDGFQGLNFSGNEHSWFDLWHTHTDLDEERIPAWEERAAALNVLVARYHYLRQKLEAYAKPYQLWMEIWENDFFEDAVYIHTPNPNTANFPAKMDYEQGAPLTDVNLKKWLDNQPLQKAVIRMADDTLILLFDKAVGLPVAPDACL